MLGYAFIYFGSIVAAGLIILAFIHAVYSTLRDRKLGKVEIVMIDGKYAVRQFGYYAGYHKPLEMDPDLGEEPILSGCLVRENIFGQKSHIYFSPRPKWSFLDKNGCSDGIMCCSSTPGYGSMWEARWFAEEVARKAMESADAMFKRINTDKQRRTEYAKKKQDAKNATVIRRM